MVGGAIWEGCAEPLETFSAKLAGLGGCNRNVYIGVNFSERKKRDRADKKVEKAEKHVSARRNHRIAWRAVLRRVSSTLDDQQGL